MWAWVHGSRLSHCACAVDKMSSSDASCKCCRCWQPLGVALVTSGSRGNKLLCYQRGHGEEEAVKDVLSELPPRTLAEILAPCSLMVGRRFELSVDNWKFVGHPFSIKTGAYASTFDVVFVLQSFCSPEVVSVYDKLSHMIGSAIVHEQERCGFFGQQVTVLMEDSESHEPFSADILKESTLAYSLNSVLRSLQEGDCHIRVQLNGWSEVSMLVPFHHAPTDKPPQSNQQLVRAYAALLLLEDSDIIAKSLPLSCNPALHRLLRTVSPMKSLKIVSVDADIPLSQVMLFASHLVHWGKAISIYPLSENNVYVTSPQADFRPSSVLSKSFREAFAESKFSLVELLYNFSLPYSLGDLKQTLMFTDEQTIKMVVWLLQNRQIIQLHTYVYIAPGPPLHLPSPSPSPSSTSSDGREGGGGGEGRSPDSDHLEEGTVERLMAQHLSRNEKRAVLESSAAADSDDLECFAKLCCYFHGTHHLEEIMLRENMTRSELRTLVDKFSEVLVTCTLPEQSQPT